MTNLNSSWMPLSVAGLPERSFEQFKKHLAQQPLTCTLLSTAVFNQLASNCMSHDDTESQEIIANALDVDDVVRRRLLSFVHGAQGPFILARPQLMELFKWAAVCCDDERSVKEIVIPANEYLTAAILAGDFASMRRDKFFKAPGELDPKARLKRALPSLRAISQWGHSGSNRLHALGRLKSLLLDKFFTVKDRRDEFRQATNLEIEDFVVAVVATINAGLQFPQMEHPKKLSFDYFTFRDSALWSKNPALKEPMEHFLKAFSISPAAWKEHVKTYAIESQTDWFDFKILRERPILRCENGICAVIDPGLFVELIAVGPLFKVLKDNAKGKLGEFGIAFEQYCQELFTRYNEYLKSGGSQASLSFNSKISSESEKIERELSDITMTYYDSLVMIETKAVWLRNDLLGSDDTDKFWDHLMEKFGVTVKSNATKDERKGVAQLADSIKALGLADFKLSDPKVLPETLTTIYPLLLVHDSLMNATGFANLLATVFAQLFDQPNVALTGFFEYKNFRIANLTLATVDEIENLIGTGSKDSFVTHLHRFNKFDPGRLLKSLDDYVHESRDCKINCGNGQTKI